jgi:hypothetical protein
MTDLSITGKGVSNWIAMGGRIVAGPYTSHGNAVAALPGIAARLRPVTVRPCLSCSTPFKSTGKGHRLCPACARNA